MDAETELLLRTLPDDLRERGWQLAESARIDSEPPRYKAIYVRAVDGRLDRGDASTSVYDRQTRQAVVRVSTLNDQSLTWHATREDAIRRMREADAKRRRRPKPHG